jgi:hypothetical protein
MNEFSWFLGCFVGVLGQKQVAKQVFGSKEHKPCFPDHHSGRNLGKTGNASSDVGMITMKI